MTAIRWILLVLIAAPLWAAPARAQRPSGAEAAAMDYVAAMRAAEWDRAAALTHPEALTELKNVFAVLAVVDTSGEMLQQFFGVRNDVEFDGLRPAVIYARLMRRLASEPRVADAMRAMRTELVGSVAEGADTVHVLYRMHTRVDETTVTKLEVLSLRRAGDRWLAMLTGDLRALADSFNRALGPR